jgi:hypothetical protein
VALGLSIVAAAVLFAWLSIRTGKSIPVGWLGLVSFTPLVFWVVLKSLRRYWKLRSFWFAVSALLLLHLLAFAAILLRYPQWPLLWFVPISFVEAGLLVVILGKLFHDGSAPST